MEKYDGFFFFFFLLFWVVLGCGWRLDGSFRSAWGFLSVDCEVRLSGCNSHARKCVYKLKEEKKNLNGTHYIITD